MIKIKSQKAVLLLSFVFSLISTVYFFSRDYIIAYGDAESHLNIAKRVVSGLTPGLAQLGGIWLPLPHLLMVPLVIPDFLWRSGLSGTIISAAAFILSSLLIFKIVKMISGREFVAFLASLVFMTNPNILYLQTTPMTEMLLIVFFLLNTYFFIKFIKEGEILSLILAGFFGLGATLTRYDGWFLVALESVLITGYFLFRKNSWQEIEGKLILFSTVAFYGIFLWLIWNILIFKTPFYFTNSIFSAKSQQLSWLARNELPAYNNLPISFLYYFVTSMSNVGIIFFGLAIAGFFRFLFDRQNKFSLIMASVLLTPFIFYVISLFLGQSVIFIPALTPARFEWRLFNVRYGVMAVPAAAIFFALLFKKATSKAVPIIILLFSLQLFLYLIGYSQIISLTDGVSGLSSAKKNDAQFWLKKNYDSGLVLLDDYARTLSIIRTGIPMKNVIYVGTKPYWEESFQEPEKYATWIIMQKDDEVWRNIYDKPEIQARLYKYFNKVYTSKEILIFKRIKISMLINNLQS